MKNQGKLIFNQTEDDKLRRALERTHTERFFLLTKLIRIGRMLKQADIKHSDKI